ncbi:hypothetical protein H6A11_07650 [Bifidobacterium pullorum subsp. saeculare]|uniref:hypothetical protein n=1 Tax=Bifidobacterium pullorum TaxID=78448 RepID=UPI00195F113C|nr:hypothetical protein [Bifidobacterium pullorum]MBM6696895.1 hypothetical protein [Bifidobacterium pullorum subsp. saeculare]
MGMEFQCAMWRHVAFDDDHGEPHRGFIISIDSHPDEPTVDVECADAVWKHVPVDRMRPDPQPPTFRPEPKKGDGPTARLYGWLASHAAAWMTTVIADGSIQEALDANEPDPEYRADWILARHAFAQACETGDIRAVRDALAGVREHATRDHVLEWSMGASYGKAAWSSPFSESWELIELLESTLIVLDPRPGDRRPHVSIAPWLSWEDGQRADRALDHPSASTVHADGSPAPLQDTPDLRLRRMIIPATRDLLARNADHLIRVVDRAQALRSGPDRMETLILASRLRAQARVAVAWNMWGMVPMLLKDAKRLTPLDSRATDRWETLALIAADRSLLGDVMLRQYDRQRDGKPTDGMFLNESELLLDALTDEELIDPDLAERIRTHGSEALR